MKVSVIRIGNSKGIRLNKIWLDKYQIEDEVELILEADTIIIKPIVKPRHDWNMAFSAVGNNEDDSLLIDSVLDNKDWD
jgi:antitoxin MazE